MHIVAYSDMNGSNDIVGVWTFGRTRNQNILTSLESRRSKR
ncbi:MAG: hypothetical protein WCT02_03520 [Candidatus Paceibacterota bacterium]